MYQTSSISLLGSMEYYTILQMLTVIELFENAHYSANHPHFRKALQSGCPFGDATVAMFALKEPGMVDWKRSNDQVSVIQCKATGGC